MVDSERCQNRMVGYYKTGHSSGATSRFAKRCERKAGPSGYCWQHERARKDTSDA